MNFSMLLTRNLNSVYSNWFNVVLSLIVPIALVFIFESIYTAIPYALFTAQSLAPGIIIFSMSYLTLFSAYTVSMDVESGFLSSMKDKKLFSVFLAYQLPFVLLGFFQLVVTLFAGALLGGSFQQILGSTIFYIFFASFLVSLGLILGLNFNPGMTMAIGSVFTLVDALFCGAWLDVNMLGKLFKTLSYYLPFANAVDIGRGMLKGLSFQLYLSPFVELLFYFIISVTVALYSLKLRKN